MAKQRVQVKRGGVIGKTWGIYVDDKLVEGGFFAKANADAAAEEYRRELEKGHSDGK